MSNRKSYVVGKNKFFKVSLAGVVLAANQALPVLAAEGGASRFIEEVVVTSQKRTQSLQDVPISVTALTGADLKKTNTTEFRDLTKVVAGLYITGPDDGLGQGMTLRGVGSQPFVNSLKPGVTLFLNDVPVNRLDSFFSNMNDVERLEVLKGPQSTLYGKEASSGVIAITTKRPELNERKGEMGVGFGSNDLLDYKGRINVPVSENSAFSLSYFKKEVDGELKNIMTGRKQHDESEGARFSFLYQPTDTLEFLTHYSIRTSNVRHEVRDRLEYGLASLASLGSYTLPLNPFDDKAEVLLANGRDTKVQNFSAHINWQISEQWQFTSITGYSLFDRQLLQGAKLPYDITTAFGGVLPEGMATGGDAAFTPFPFLIVASESTPRNERVRLQEFRLNYEGEKWSSLYGVYYNETDSNANTSILSGGTVPLALPAEGGSKDLAVFTDHTYHLSQKWDLIAGLRYSETKKYSLSSTIVGGGIFGNGLETLGPKQENTWENVSGSIKSVYFASDDVNFFAGISQGFKAGGFNSVGTPGYDEEITINYEVGMKGLFFDKSLSLNASVFYQTYDDYQVESFDPDLASTRYIFSNAASVEVEGVEMDFQWLATDHLTVAGAFAYINARYDEYEDAPCSDDQLVPLVGVAVGTTLNGCTIINSSVSSLSGYTDRSGKRLFQTSPFTANLSLQYDDSLSNGLNWFVRGDTSFRDDYFGFNTLQSTTHQSSYMLFDASMGLRSADGRWNISIYGKNLADEDYISGFLPGRDLALGVVIIKGTGRTFGISTNYHF